MSDDVLYVLDLLAGISGLCLSFFGQFPNKERDRLTLRVKS
jgi:hypothetical protein